MKMLKRTFLVGVIGLIGLSACQNEDELAPQTTSELGLGTPISIEGNYASVEAQTKVLNSADKNAQNQNTPTYAKLRKRILELTNAHRRKQGLPILKVHNVLNEESRLHSDNMANGTVPFGHDGFNERGSRIFAQLGGRGIAENVALGYRNAKSVMDGWLSSSGHRRNIEGDYTHIGIGVSNGNGSLYYTQIFLNSPNLK